MYPGAAAVAPFFSTLTGLSDMDGLIILVWWIGTAWLCSEGWD